MKTRITTIFCLLLMIGMQAKAQGFESAASAVKNMGVGWNLGNTLDANKQTEFDINSDNFWGQQGLESETCWGQPKTTRELIKMMKEAGFTAIRVPVTWYNHMDNDGAISGEWMVRVKEVVDYVIDEGLYCILNVHHDTGSDIDFNTGTQTGYHWLKADKDNYEQNILRYTALWAQIALTFKDYGEKLLFEGFNEMLDANSCWNYPTWSSSSDYNEESAKASYDAINNYNQLFVSTVRLTGGNNSERNLIINPYAAASGGEWGNNKHPQEPLETLALPTDDTENHLIVEVHSYPSIESGISSAKSGLDWTFNNLNEKIIKRLNVPLIVGEWGTSNVDNGSDYVERRETMIAFCDYFVKKAMEYDIATFYWMGLSDGQYRSQLVFNQPDLAETITKAYHGDDFEGKYPAAETPTGGVIFEDEKQLEWGEAINVGPEFFADLANTSTLEVTYVQNYADLDEDNQYGMLQFWYNDWSTMINVIAEGNTFNGDFVPSDVYGTESGTEHTTVFSFDADTFKNFKTKGLLFQGHGILVKKVVLNAVKEDPNPGEDEEVFWEGDAVLDWGDGLQLIIPAEKFAAYGNGVKLGLFYTLDFEDYNMIQLFYGDWKSNPSFIIEGKEYEKEYTPSTVHGLNNGDDGMSELTFSEAVYKEVSEKGIALQGHGLRLKKVTLASSSGETAIQGVVKAERNDDVIYNLAGQRVTNPTKGIYIKNGKKFVIK